MERGDRNVSTTIDERVVEMRFDNRQFENNIKDSITSLDELKKSLDLNTAATKLNNFLQIFTTAFHGAKAVIDGLVGSVKGIANEIGQLTGVTQLISSQTSKMKQAFADLTGGAITSGFQEYELKLNSVRTILSNVKDSGKTIDDVTYALEKLNKYADQTIYNFGEMTRNIGYFTVAGVELDTAVSAIKGLSNLAALQGVDSSSAARATYQMSQALSSGYIKLMDWRSMENAGMAGKQFQNAIIDTAKRHGIDYDKILAGEIDAAGKKKKTVKAYGSFRETLAEGWLTADLMMEALQMYSGDYGEDFINYMKETGKNSEYFQKALSGDTEVLKRYGLEWNDIKNLDEDEKIDRITRAISDLGVELRSEETIDYLMHAYSMTYEEAKEAWKMAKEANEAAKEVTTFTKLMDALKEAAQSGWSQSWEIIIGGLEGAKSIWTKVNDEIGGMLQQSADKRNAMLKEWRTSSELITSYDEDGNAKTHMFFDAIANFYQGLKGIGGHVKKIFADMFGTITSNTLIEGTKKFYALSKSFKEWVTGTGDAQSKLSSLTPIITAVGSAVKFLINTVKAVKTTIFGIIKKILFSEEVSSGITKISEGISKLFSKLSNAGVLEKIGSVLTSVILPVVKVLGAALKFVLTIVSGLAKKIKESGLADKFKGLFGKLGEWVSGAIEKVSELAKKIIDWFANSSVIQTAVDWLMKAVTWLAGNISKAFGFIRDVFMKAWNWIKSINFQSLFTNIWNGIKDFFSNFGSNIAKAGSAIINFITSTAKKIWGGIRKVFSWIGSAFNKIGVNVGGFFKKIFGGVKTGASNTVKGLNESAKTINNGVQDFLKNVLNSISGLTKKALPALTAIAKMYTIFSTGRLLSGIASFGRGFGKLGKQMAKGIKEFRKEGGFESLSNWINDPNFTLTKIEKKVDSWPTTILKLSTSLALLVGSIKLLTTIGKEDFKTSLGRLGQIAIALAGFVFVMGTLGKIFKGGFGIDFSDTGKTLLSLTISIAAMAVAIKLFSSNFISDDEFINGGLKAGAVLLVLAGAFAIIGRASKTAEGKLKRSRIPFLKMAVALVVMLGVIKLYNKVFKGNVKNWIGGVLGVIGAMAALTTSMYFLGKTGSNAKKAAKPLLKICAAILILGLAMKIIGKMDATTFGRGFVAVGAFLLGIFGILKTMMRTKAPLRKSVSMLIGLGSVVAAVYALSKAVEVFGKMSTSSYVKGFGTVAAILIAIIALAAVSKKLKWTSGLKLGAFVAEFALVMGAIGFLVGMITNEGEITPMIGNGLASLGRGIGRFIGGLFDGITSEYGLAQLGAHLSAFGENAKPFFENFMPLLTNLPSDSFSKLKTFAESLGALNGAKGINGGGGILKLGKIKAAGGYVEVAQDYEKYARGLRMILDSLGKFMSTLSKFSSSDVSRINSALPIVKDVIDIIGDMPVPDKAVIVGGLGGGAGFGIGGFYAQVSQDYDKYATGLQTILDSVGRFLTVASGFTPEQVTQINAAKPTIEGVFTALGELAPPLSSIIVAGALGPVIGAVILKWQDFDSWAKGLELLLPAIGDFFGAIADNGKLTAADFGEYGKVGRAVALLTNLARGLSDVGTPIESLKTAGILSWAGDSFTLLGMSAVTYTSFSSYGSAVQNIVDAVSGFADKINDMKTDEQYKRFEAALTKVSDFFTNTSSLTLPKAEYKTADTTTWYQPFSEYGEGVALIIGAIANFSETVKGLNGTQLNIFSSALTSVQNFFNSTVDAQTGISVEELKSASGDAQINWYQPFDQWSTAVSRVIGSVNSFANKIFENPEIFAENGKFATAMDTLKTFIVDIAGVQLSEIESSTSTTTEGADGSRFISIIQSKRTTFDDLTKNLPGLIDSTGGLLDVLKGTGEGAFLTYRQQLSKLTSENEIENLSEVFGQISTFIGALAAISMPVIETVTVDKTVEEGKETVSELTVKASTMEQLTAGLPALIDATGSLISTLDLLYGDEANQETYADKLGSITEKGGMLEEVLSNISTFLNALQVSLPIEAVTSSLTNIQGQSHDMTRNIQSVSSSGYELSDYGEFLSDVIGAFGRFVDSLTIADFYQTADEAGLAASEKKIANLERLVNNWTLKSLLTDISDFLVSLNELSPVATNYVSAVGKYSGAWSNEGDIYDTTLEKINFDVTYDSLSNLLTHITEFVNSLGSLEIDYSTVNTTLTKLTSFMDAIIGLLDFVVVWTQDTWTEQYQKIMGINPKTGEDNLIPTLPEADSIASGIFASVESFLTDGLLSWLDELNAKITSDEFELDKIQGLMSGLTGLLESVRALTPTEGYTSVSDIAIPLGAAIMDGASSGVVERQSDLSETIEKVVAGAITSIEGSIKSKFITAGANFAAGMAAGIRSGIAGIRAAAQEAGNAAINSTNTTLDEHSPSRVMMQSGRFFDEGLALGILKNIGDVTDASSEVSQSAVDQLMGINDILASLFNGALMANGDTLSPVVDMSNFTFDTDSFNRSDKSFDMAMSRNMANDSFTMHQNGQNGDVVAAINSMSEKLDNLANDMLNVKVVLDSGILAGHLARGIDRHLGNMIDSTKRRNAV